MASVAHPLLTSPLKIGNVTLRNRMVFTGHNSKLQESNGLVGDRYIAYQVRRTRGGAGLQILCGATVDDMSLTSQDQLRLSSDEAIPGLQRMVAAVEREGGTVFAQLLHPGREIYESDDGTKPRAYSASEVRSERFYVVPRALTVTQIRGIIQSYAEAAKRAVRAGLHGIEIIANQGNLPAQFLTPSVNKRTDEYGGSEENRQRFLLEVARGVRAAVGLDIPVGIRISVSDMDNVGLEAEDTVAACKRIDSENLVDFWHVVLGTPATRAGSSHIVAPMYQPTGYITPFSARIKKVVRAPVIATGRYNTPQAAEEAIRSGAADAVGMNRAMISDPDLGVKVMGDRLDDIRACIGCVQACIGHFQKGYPVSCIQYPETGRELTLGAYGTAKLPKRIMIAGGGPAGMKAAAVAAARGHQVILCEASGSLGGQANLAARLPGRAEFGGLVTNLQHEVQLAQVQIRLHTRVTRELVEAEQPDALIIATGGTASTPDSENISGMQVVTAHDVVADKVKVGGRVIIADCTADWVGVGVARKLAAAGHHVTLAVNGLMPAETLPPYVRDESAAGLFNAGVEVVNYARLFGADGGTVYFEHVFALKPIEFENVDTLVICHGASADRTLEAELAGLNIQTEIIGDSWSPRTAEEAVLEGLKVAIEL
ncbi:FAD-dependent oxidoreductase [Mesorhizobium sp. WSM4887]|uniref:oxidoreductase n=1 Tax=Mesorhizobium sp. WSM4887 TaxID=3038543 RepID=UPI0024162D37|nr:FAD-dependent oxidoreductase [Mesorhizobium sp. WSM4887]MDG4886812.1 FAD-dependent oxidoreductase [Mesorhizobium sp. WSM4887]